MTLLFGDIFSLGSTDLFEIDDSNLFELATVIDYIPFDNILTPVHHSLFVSAIDEVLRAFSVAATIYYGSTKFTTCPNCIQDIIGNKSSGRYQSGGPMPFPNGRQCPMCSGRGQISLETSVSTTLPIIYNEKNWYDKVPAADGSLLTVTKMNLYEELSKAKYIVVGQDATEYGLFKYEREGKPEMGGFGASDYIIQRWRRI